MKLEKQLSGKITFVALLCFGLLLSCKNKPQEKQAAEPFVLNDTMAKKIELSTAVTEPVENELRLSAKVEANQDKLVDVYSLVSGRVRGMNVSLGDYVEKGQTLANILSGDVASAERDLLAAKSNLLNTKRKLDAANDLFKSGLISEKELIQTKTENSQAEAELEKAKKLLELYGSDNLKGYYEVKSPISGYIVKKNITDNQDVKSDFTTPIFSIIDLSQVWIMANVYESDIRKIGLGNEAEITTIAYPDSVIYGKVDRLFEVLDPESKIMKARITINNASKLLKPEMFARVLIRYREAEQRLAIPSSAVIFDNSKSYVMVYKDRSHIETRLIDIYKSNSVKTYVDGGLKEGEKVISKYQLLVYDAIND
jgi:cobalt-zinc-cadmium efflux system membrane fusion protein